MGCPTKGCLSSLPTLVEWWDTRLLLPAPITRFTVGHAFRLPLSVPFCTFCSKVLIPPAPAQGIFPTVKRVIFPHPGCLRDNVDGRNLSDSRLRP